MITAGHDRAIRIFLRSNEMVILEEEREREQEEQLDSALDRDGDRTAGMDAPLPVPDAAAQLTGDAGKEVVMEKEESNRAVEVYSGSMRAADVLISTLERADAAERRKKEWEEECAYVKSTLTEEEFQKRPANGTKPLVPPPEKDAFMMNMTPCEFVATTIR